MPPRHAFWTILVDDQPTAFRAHDPEELLATLNRLKEKHPSAVMRWFERGKLWESREAARHEGFGRGERRWEGPREDRGRQRGRPDQPRDPNWRPGDEHRDPRQQYKDAKKAKWQRFKQKIRDGHARRDRPSPLPPPQPDSQRVSPPHGDPLRQASGQESGVRDQESGIRDQGSGVRNQGSGNRRRREWRDQRTEWPNEAQSKRSGGASAFAKAPADRSAPPSGFTDHGSSDRRPRDRRDDRGESQNRERPRGEWRDRPPRDREPQRDFRDRSFDDRRQDGDRRNDRPEGQSRERPRSEWRDRPPRDPDARRDFRDRSFDDRRERGSPNERRGFKSDHGADRNRPPKSDGKRKPWGSKPGRSSAAGRGPRSRKPWGSKPSGGGFKTRPHGGAAHGRKRRRDK